MNQQFIFKVYQLLMMMMMVLTLNANFVQSSIINYLKGENKIFKIPVSLNDERIIHSLVHLLVCLLLFIFDKSDESDATEIKILL